MSKRIDGLHQQLQARGLQLGRGIPKIGHQRGLCGHAVGTRGQLASQAVQLAHAQHLRVADGTGHALAELGLAARVAGDAALAGVPVAGRQIVQHQLQAVRVQPRLDSSAAGNG
jgi:hypothetical protein